VGEVCWFITQTFISTPGVPPLWLRRKPRYALALKSARMSDDTRKFRIGSVQYLNAVPLTRVFFEKMPAPGQTYRHVCHRA
jgi:hypothetical protein